MRVRLETLGPLAPLLRWTLVCLLLLSGARLALVGWRWDAVPVADLPMLLVVGLRMDLLFVCYVLILPAMLQLALPAGRTRDLLVVTPLAAALVYMVFIEYATPAFMAEYDKRPDRIFYEYLIYPRQVLTMLWEGHRLQLLSIPLVIAGSAYLAARLAWRWQRAATPWSWQRRLVAFPLVVSLIAIGGRSSFDHRPANASTAAFSTNRVVNELALNSAYSLAYAVYRSGDEVDAARLYGAMDWDEVQARVARYRSAPPAPRSAQPRRNLVIIIQESMGAQFVGHLGGLPLTPELDALAGEGLWFPQLYATGTRTVRGLEAVVAGFPPSPAPGVLRLPRARDGFFTLGTLLQSQGYRTQFIYGGGANFDNMRAFFLANGFDRVIEQADYEAPSFVASWGVSDWDLMERAHQEFLAHGDQPFLGVVLSSTNHDPFEIPAGAIEPYNQPLFTRENAILFADHAVGRFFELARSAPYWQDTVFLVVADHDARVEGAELLPLRHFRVPGVILGPGVPVGPWPRIASQIDLAPTLLGLIGVDAPTPMIGRDLLDLPADVPGRALMQHDATHGLLVGDRLVLHQPDQAPAMFRVEGDDLVPIATDPELARDARAHALWSYETYRRRAYKLPDAANGN